MAALQAFYTVDSSLCNFKLGRSFRLWHVTINRWSDSCEKSLVPWMSNWTRRTHRYNWLPLLLWSQPLGLAPISSCSTMMKVRRKITVWPDLHSIDGQCSSRSFNPSETSRLPSGSSLSLRSTWNRCSTGQNSQICLCRNSEKCGRTWIRPNFTRKRPFESTRDPLLWQDSPVDLSRKICSTNSRSTTSSKRSITSRVKCLAAFTSCLMKRCQSSIIEYSIH